MTGARPAQQGGGTALPSVAVIVATLGRHPGLERCLRSLLGQTVSPVEIIVVDNDPVASATKALCERLGGLRWLPEPSRGTSVARNSGIAAASAELLLFTDDDAVPDPGWVAALAAVHAADPSVHCATGLVLPAQLEADAHRWFEAYGSFSKGNDPRRWSLAEPGPDAGPLFPWTPGRFGSGNNMSLRADSAKALGGFDPVLGPGTPTRSAEDLDLFLRVLQGGGVLAYDPCAVVRHAHRETLPELREQVHGYGVGLGALFAKHLVSAASRRDIARRVPRGVRFLLARDSAKNAGKGADYPRSLTSDELRGVLAGPAAYLRSRGQTLAPRLPWQVLEWDLATDAPRALPRGGAVVQPARTWILVRRGAAVLGTATTSGDADEATLRAAAVTVRERVADVPPGDLPAFTVVVPSLLARPHGLRACLEGLAGLDYDPARLEVLLVDNRAGGERPAWLDDTGVRVLRQARPGISAARNAGLAAATGRYVAFTDDDAVADPQWLRALATGFAMAPDVACVTGLVAPRELETAAQQLFEEWGGSAARGFRPTVFRATAPFRVGADDGRSFSLYATGDYGIGSNMAFDTARLRAAGGFDEALGVGTPSRAGEDIAAFIRLLRRGEALAFAPDALVWHAHRRSGAELSGQLHGYGVGFTAMLCSLVAEDPRHLPGLAAHLRAGLRGLWAGDSAKNAGRGADFPAVLRRSELRGLLTGPLAYGRSRAAA